MRTLCDVCESAAAVRFCAADEAALCRACDDKVHTCNKLASRHVRVGIVNPIAVPKCDICENSPAFFYCEVDGSSLCMQCDMFVHVGGKRIHPRYLLLRQRVEFQGDEPGVMVEFTKPLDSAENKNAKDDEEKFENVNSDAEMQSKPNSQLIDLNMKPDWFHGQASNSHAG